MGARAVRTAFGLSDTPMGLDESAVRYVNRAKQIQEAKDAQHGKTESLGNRAKNLAKASVVPGGVGLLMAAGGPATARREIESGETPLWGRGARMAPTTAMTEPALTSDSPMRGAGLSGIEALKMGLAAAGGPAGLGFYGAHKANQNFQPNDQARRFTGYGLMAAQAGLDTAGLLPEVAKSGVGDALTQIGQFPFGGIPEAAGSGMGATALNFAGNTLKSGPTAVNVSGDVMQRLEQMAKEKMYTKFGPGRLQQRAPGVGLFGGM